MLNRSVCNVLRRQTVRLASTKTPVVNSYTEWDTLEEVLVGRSTGACVPSWEPPLKSIVPGAIADNFKKMAGKPFPEQMVKKANEQVDEYCKVLEGEGCKVVRPEEFDSSIPFKTPTFSCDVGYMTSVPRDIFIIMGDTILEATMGMRGRFFDYIPYRKLMRSYFDRGAKWIAAPKPNFDEGCFLPDDQFEQKDEYGSDKYWQLTNEEIVFEAAVFQRLGKDIVVQQSNVCNAAGIEWVRRHFPQFNFHELSLANNPLHIDTALAPLAPGKLLLNPRRPGQFGDFKHWFTYNGQKLPFHLPDIFKGWDIFIADIPPPVRGDKPFLLTASDLAVANLLSLDEKRIIVETQEEPWHKRLESWGFKPVKVTFDVAMEFGGAFHCHTVDIRRKGGMQSYC